MEIQPLIIYQMHSFDLSLDHKAENLLSCIVQKKTKRMTDQKQYAYNLKS